MVTKSVLLWGPSVWATGFQVGDANAPCGTRINGATIPPGYAQCADPFCVDLPKDFGKIVSIQLYAKDHSGEKKCDNVEGVDCDIGWSRFWHSPEAQPEGKPIVCGHFKNRSHDRDRTPGFLVTYIPKN
jgi:hypothetical protein